MEAEVCVTVGECNAPPLKMGYNYDHRLINNNPFSTAAGNGTQTGAGLGVESFGACSNDRASIIK
jgi:hypothetical protein